MKTIELNSQPWSDMRALLASGAPVYLPVSPVEYHGPHLSLLNDSIIGMGIGRDLHERLARRRPDWPMIVAPELGVGCGVVRGPGSRPSPFARVRALVRNACGALADLGVQRVVFLGFHGDPLHNWALRDGMDLLAGRGVPSFTPMHAILPELVSLDGDKYAPLLDLVPDRRDRESLREGLSSDFHGGFLETSLTLHFAPETVASGYRDVPPCPRPVPFAPLMALAAVFQGLGRHEMAREARFIAGGVAWLALKPFPGYTGRPGLARAEVGAWLAAAIADRAEALATEVLLGGASQPPPPFAWLRAVSLDGAIGSEGVGHVLTKGPHR